LTLPQVIYLYCQGFDIKRSDEKTEAIRMYISTIAAMSKEGHKLLEEYLDSFTEVLNMEEMKTTMSDAMKKFLKLDSPKEESVESNG